MLGMRLSWVVRLQLTIQHHVVLGRHHTRTVLLMISLSLPIALGVLSRTHLLHVGKQLVGYELWLVQLAKPVLTRAILYVITSGTRDRDARVVAQIVAGADRATVRHSAIESYRHVQTLRYMVLHGTGAAEVLIREGSFFRGSLPD